jgi:putative ABC transport system permease protein
MAGLRQDVRAAWRQLRRSPAFAMTAVITFSCGLAMSAAISSILHALVIRPLPIPDPHGLISVSGVTATGERRLTPITAIAELADGPLDPLCAIAGGAILAVDVNGTPTQALGSFVSGRCFELLGVPPLHGRWITDADAPLMARGRPVVVIGHRFWTRMFGTDPAAIGQTLHIEGETLTVAGVLPASFDGVYVDAGTDIYFPFSTIVPDPPGRRPGSSYLLGRLRPGISLDEAAAELSTRWPSLLRAIVPDSLPAAVRDDMRAVRPRVERLATGISTYRDRYARPLGLVLGLTVVLLALTCANLGGLLLARLSARNHELAVRTALGGSAWRVGRLLLFESVGLTAAGAMLAVPIAWGVGTALVSLLPPSQVPRAVTFAPDWPVVVFVGAVATVMALLTAAAPLIAMLRTTTIGRLMSPRAIAGASSHWAHRLLVVQVALSTVLLVVAGLLGRSLYLLQHNAVGMRPEGVLVATVMPRPGAYHDLDLASHYPPLFERLASIPGVRSVGASRIFPRLTIDSPGQTIALVGAQTSDLRAVLDVASPDFFATVGIPLLAGRPPAWSDTRQSQLVGWVNAGLARRLAPNGEVLGRRVIHAGGFATDEVTIVGVVGDTTMGHPRWTAVNALYRPTLQVPGLANYPTVSVRFDGNSRSVVTALRQAFDATGREYAARIDLLTDILARAPASERMSAGVSVVVGTMAALIAGIGLHGLLAFQVSRREREFGVRLAVGANPRQLVGLVLTDGARIAVLGLAFGMPLAWLATRSLAGLTFGVAISDPMTFMSVGALIAALVVAAGFHPARKAAAVDPAISLRAE